MSGSVAAVAALAAEHPDAVVGLVDPLVATDDSSPRVRAGADCAPERLHGAAGRTRLRHAPHRRPSRRRLRGCARTRRSTGRDRGRAGTGYRRPAGRDRLRRLQRDPAVDIDPERLQDASTAIQTGVPAENTETADDADRADIWTPESADEMGVSGETNVFEPVGDEFEGTFDEDAGADDSTDDAVTDRDTVVEGDDSTDDPTTLGEQDTVVRSDESDDDSGG